MAVCRARESERPEAVFKDPFAQALAGDEVHDGCLDWLRPIDEGRLRWILQEWDGPSARQELECLVGVAHRLEPVEFLLSELFFKQRGHLLRVGEIGAGKKALF